MDNFPFRVNTIDKEKFVEIREINIPLDTATDDKKFAFSGNVFYMSDATDVNVSLTVRFNDLQIEPITFTKGLGFGIPFKRVYLSWAAQAGKVATILVGVTDEDFKVFDNRSASQSTSTLESILQQMEGDSIAENWNSESTVGTSAVKLYDANTDRVEVFVQSKLSNTGLIYIGLGNTVTSTKWVAELEPGDAIVIDRSLADIYAISDTAGQKVGGVEL